MKPDDLEPLSESMRSLLGSERVLDPVPAAAKARLAQRLASTMAQGAATAATTTAAKTAAHSASASGTIGTAVGSKLVIGLVSFAIGGSVGAGVHAALTRPQPAPPTVVQPQLPPPPPKPEAVEAPAEPANEALPAPKPMVKAPRSPRSPDSLGAERSLIEQARAALARGDGAGALSVLAQHQAGFADGQLAEERMALQVMALAQSGQLARAQELARLFRAQHPGSLLIPSVDAAVNGAAK